MRGWSPRSTSFRLVRHSVAEWDVAAVFENGTVGIGLVAVFDHPMMPAQMCDDEATVAPNACRNGSRNGTRAIGMETVTHSSNDRKSIAAWPGKVHSNHGCRMIHPMERMQWNGNGGSEIDDGCANRVRRPQARCRFRR